MKTIGIMANLQKKEVLGLVEEVCGFLGNRGIDVIVQPELSPEGVSDIKKRPLPAMLDSINCLLVLGGDGTILRSARLAARAGVPVLGINLGRLGFLSEIDIPDIGPGLESVIRGEYHIEERMMIEATVLRDGSEIEKSTGLNDAVITKGAFARLILLQTRVDGETVSNYPADGLIVSTSTGSTAYSLSAGGPVVTPELEIMLITPICPHALWARPIVIGPESVVEVELLSEKAEVMLTIDGQHGMRLGRGDVVRITRSPHKVKFVRLITRNFFRVLKQKLREGDNR